MTTQDMSSWVTGDALYATRYAVRDAAERDRAPSLALSGAARELQLRRGELDLAVQLGQVRTASDARGGPPRIPRHEIDRLRAAEGFPDVLRERVRAVGTREAAELLSITGHRFTCLARTGHFIPVRFYLNRYRAVVWMYLACELRDFAQDHADLLTGRMPPVVRAALDAGADRRPRNWRGRKLGMLLRATSDPWLRAAAIAAVLDPVTVAEVVPDPYERSRLRVLRPELLTGGRPQSPAGRELVDRLLLADHPDEILWHRMSLAEALHEARRLSPAPRPVQAAGPGASGQTARRPATRLLPRRTPCALRTPRPPHARRALLDRLRRRKPDPAD
ncbi:hypothetical protein J7E88_09010 [Streptomyces sp. ISL-10]|uniref:DUF6397 family protein n=1 Tax=Streptomyces sp. ISL-10 TaxID=2819172 RepID=UPI001BE9C146|nr:DUF6397 family protein [Streptomyces sp. ISL-10]MBT2365454.1 hypothetical protein [Streptomyces sp. ISL-10]